MLVLTRKVKENFVIVCPDGTELWVSLAEMQYDRVRIGIEAPFEYKIYREEVYKDMKEGKPYPKKFKEEKPENEKV